MRNIARIAMGIGLVVGRRTAVRWPRRGCRLPMILQPQIPRVLFKSRHRPRSRLR